ncbi:MAG: molecular chaperone TorD family protein [Vulcanibacillus sp.]
MQKITENKIEAKEEIYLILAEFFKNPTEDFYLEISNGTIDERLKTLYSIADYNYPDTISFIDQFPNYSSYVNSYTLSFLVGAKSCTPVESIYKVWTSDPSNEMYNTKGSIFGDPALHIRYLFEQYKLELPNEYANIPDHITLLLEFLAFLIKNRTSTEVKQFISDHFDWLEDFKKELSKTEFSSLYLDITDLIINTTQNELLYLVSNKE